MVKGMIAAFAYLNMQRGAVHTAPRWKANRSLLGHAVTIVADGGNSQGHAAELLRRAETLSVDREAAGQVFGILLGEDAEGFLAELKLLHGGTPVGGRGIEWLIPGG
jgi:folylpolyglutamate synthase/dihydropteroate synthase